MASAGDALNTPITARTKPMSIIRRVNVPATLPPELVQNEEWNSAGQNADRQNTQNTPRADHGPVVQRRRQSPSACVLLLVLVTTSQGGFQIGRWTPLALFALAVHSEGSWHEGAWRSTPVPHGWRWLESGDWGLGRWPQCCGRNRPATHSRPPTAGSCTRQSRRFRSAASTEAVAGCNDLGPRRSDRLVATYVLVRLMINGAPLFLAGRLNGPINYRNATALLFALPVWPAVIAASTARYPRGARALAFGAATLCLGLAFLTQSRGIVLGLALGGVVVLALGPDRVRRAWTAIITLAAVAIASPWLLRPFHAFDGGDGFVTTHQIAVAADALAIATVAAVAVGMAIALFDSGLRTNDARMRYVRLAARIGLTVAVLATLIAAGVAIAVRPAT